MATNKASYGVLTAVTITLANLANAAFREALKVNNSANAFLDMQLEVVIAANGVAAGDRLVNVYLARSMDGVAWPDVVTGADAAITPDDTRNLQHLGVIYFPAAGTVTRKGIFDTAVGPNAGLALTPYWTVIVENRLGVAIAAAGSSVKYGGLQILEQ